MAHFSGAPLQRLYAQIHSTLGTVPNTSGTWTNTGAKLIPHMKADLKRLVELIKADYMTGTGSMLAGTQGRAAGSFSCEVPLMPSGAAGTAPNTDPILTNVFGQAGAVVAVTSVTYTFSDTDANPLILALFNESATTCQQQFGYGGVTESFTINLGGSGVVNLGCDGKFFYVIEKDYFSSDDSTAKGGLTTFPAEPGSPTLAGNQIGSFTATVTFGGTSVAEFVSASIRGTTGRTLRADGIGRYPTGIVQGRRNISLQSLKFADSDGAGLVAVKNAAASKTPMDVVIVQGTVAGYIVTHTIKQVQFGSDGFSISQSGSGIDVNFGDVDANASALASVNDYTLAFT